MTRSGSKEIVPTITKRRRNVLILLVIGAASLLIRLLSLLPIPLRIYSETLVAYEKHTINFIYHRFIDPAWYFGRLQENEIRQTARLLLNELSIPKEVYKNSGESHVYK